MSDSDQRTMSDLRESIREFCDERDWGQFHSPKNLTMALSVEVSELMEHFQWLTEEGSRAPSEEVKQAAKEEIGDVIIYLTRLADQLGIDPLSAGFEKMEKNRIKYPADKSRGRMNKYTDYQ